jgi:hypothetical protein
MGQYGVGQFAVAPLTLGGQSPLGFGELLRRLPVTFGKDRLPGAFFPRPVRIVTKNPNTPYFVTSTIVAWIPVFTHKDHFEILAGSLERQRISAVAGGKLELPG